MKDILGSWSIRDFVGVEGCLGIIGCLIIIGLVKMGVIFFRGCWGMIEGKGFNILGEKYFVWGKGCWGCINGIYGLVVVGMYGSLVGYIVFCGIGWGFM